MNRRGFVGRIVAGVAALCCGGAATKASIAPQKALCIQTDEWIQNSQMQRLKYWHEERKARMEDGKKYGVQMAFSFHD